MHSDLFQSQPWDCIPTIQGGETLFSWCCLYHRISGSSCANNTSKRLFASATSGFVRDFPARIDNLVQVTDSLLGDADHIILEHTLYRLYSRFRPDETMVKIRSMMRSNSVERLKFILGLPASRANTSHPLKFCRNCVAEEAQSSGFARWWIDLQWPTAWGCARHNQLLDYAVAGPNGSSKSTWVLPSDLEPSEITSLDEVLSARVADLIALANLTAEVADLDNNYSPEILRLVFLSAIKNRGWATPFGTVQYATVRDEFQKHCGDFILLPGMDFINSVNQEDFGFLGALLHGRTRFLHPSKYLLMIHFLFNDFNTFLESYVKYSATHHNMTGLKQKILDPGREQREKELHRLVVNEARSLNQAAQILNISISNVIVWARKNNIRYKRRPRKKSEHFESALKSLIAKGASRHEISIELGIRRQWITAFFERHPDLREFWREQNLVAMTKQRREGFLDFLNRHEGVPLNKLRALPGNGYHWLFQHDPQWLQENLPMM